MESCITILDIIVDHFHPNNIVVIVLGGSDTVSATPNTILVGDVLSQLHLSCGNAAPNIHQMDTL